MGYGKGICYNTLSEIAAVFLEWDYGLSYDCLRGLLDLLVALPEFPLLVPKELFIDYFFILFSTIFSRPFLLHLSSTFNFS